MKIAALLVLLLWSRWLLADTLTMTSGDILTGSITAATNGTYQLRMANADFSIISVRILPTNEIASVIRDTPEQKAARDAYETICRYRLQADREQSPAQCERVLALLQQFLQDHPDNLATPRVREKLTLWTDELAHVSRGEAKFQNRWLSPTAKAAAIREAAHQARLQAGQTAVEKLRKPIAKEDAYRTEIAKMLAAAERDLAAAEQFLAGLRDHTEPVYEYRPVSGYPQAFPTRNGYLLWTPPFWERVVTDEKVIVNPQRGTAEKRVLDYQNSVNNYRSELENIDHRLIDLRAKLTQAEAALAKETESLK